MRTANRIAGLVVGVLLVVVGIGGVLVAAGNGFPGSATPLFGILTTNVLLGILQSVSGATLLGASLVAQRVSVIVNSWVGAGLLVLGLAGLFLVGTEVNAVAASATVNALHFAAASLLLLVGLGADRRETGPS